jgi:trimethylamine:corrinoid methyltransferase-like protein
MFERSLLRDEDVEPLADAVLTVLEKVGALYQNEEILRSLEAQGAKVDHSRQVAAFPRKMVCEFLDKVRSEAPKPQTDTGHKKFSAPGEGRLFHQLSQFFYDSEKKERRLGNKQDLISLIKLGEALHPKDGVGQSLLLADVPAHVEPLESTLLQFEYAHKPRGAYVQDIRQIDYLRQMEEISGIADLHWLANVGFSSPLRLGKDIADRFVYTLKLGRAANLYVMTVCGAGTPVTTAGCVVVCAAELIANWIVGRALNPGAGLHGGVWLATMDMRTGESSYLAFDAMVRGFAVREFLRRWTGLSVGVGGGEYCPAKTPGLYAALEKAYRAMTVAAFTGSHPGVGIGHLDGGLTISPVQFLLDREMAKALEHLKCPIVVNKEAISLEAILEVGHASETNYLETENTLRHFRSVLWLPELLERCGWTGLDTEEKVLNRAQKRVNELLAAYKKPEVDGRKLEQMRKVVEKARRALS